MVPVLTLTPPIMSRRSTTATRRPSFAAAIAAFCPLGPDPRTSRSKCSTATVSQVCAPNRDWRVSPCRRPPPTRRFTTCTNARSRMGREVRVSFPPGAVAAAEPGTPEHEELLRYVERLALTFASAGWPRMASRVFAYALAHNADRYTAAELSRALRVRPAAVSGAVRYLGSDGLSARDREPGACVDTDRRYRVLWYEIALQRGDYIDPFVKVAEEGAELLGRDTPGGRRMAETAEF